MVLCEVLSLYEINQQSLTTNVCDSQTSKNLQGFEREELVAVLFNVVRNILVTGKMKITYFVGPVYLDRCTLTQKTVTKRRLQAKNHLLGLKKPKDGWQKDGFISC